MTLWALSLRVPPLARTFPGLVARMGGRLLCWGWPRTTAGRGAITRRSTCFPARQTMALFKRGPVERGRQMRTGCRISRAKRSWSNRTRVSDRRRSLRSLSSWDGRVEKFWTEPSLFESPDCEDLNLQPGAEPPQMCRVFSVCDWK